MRVTFVVAGGFSLDGGQRVIANTADGLSRRGHEVRIVLVPRPPPSLRSRLSDLRHGRGIGPGTRRGPSHFDQFELSIRLLERFRAVIDADVPDADAVIATWWETAEWVAALTPAKGEKYYFIQNYEISDWWPTERVHATYRLPLRKLVVSSWLVDVVRSTPEESIPVVEHGLDHAQFHAPPRGKQAAPTVGLLYSATAWKGVDVALRAIELARQSVPELRLVAFGADRPRPDLPLPRHTAFIYRPPQAMLRELYAQCDVWLCASWREGFHLPPLEAMACRCPVVSTEVGGPRDTVRPGLNGYLVRPGDAQALADRLVEVVRLPDPAWRTMSESAWLTASRYSWDESVRRFEAALLGRPLAGPH